MPPEDERADLRIVLGLTWRDLLSTSLLDSEFGVAPGRLVRYRDGSDAAHPARCP